MNTVVSSKRTASRRRNFKKKNLVYLKHNGNGHLSLDMVAEPELVLDLLADKWSRSGYIEAIGDVSPHLSHVDSYAGTIGVFDKTKKRHLEMLVFHTQEFANSRRRR